MTSDLPAFSLLDEPWVKVRRLSGQVEELSLVELFEQAAALRDLAGELPTQDVAVLRVLEAVLLGATRPAYPRTDDENLDLWESWWNAGSFPDAVREYLERHRDRFNLFDPVAPFLQVADLRTASGNASGLSKLITDVPAGHQYFTTRAGQELTSMSYGEAARWLIHCHAFDCSGIKTGAVGDARVKGGRGYPLGPPAWAGNLGLVVIQGETVFQTLMLNLPLPMGRPDDRPVWERPPHKASVALDHPAPLGPADVFTWPSRRVRLFPRAGRVVDVQISNGDPLGPQNQQTNEPMSSWKKSQTQSKGGVDVYMPVRHSPQKRVWQGLQSLLLQTKGESYRAPALEWLDLLRRAGSLSGGYKTALHVTGIEYGAKASSVVGAVDDRLQVHVAAITDPVLAQVAADAAARAGEGVVALANLATNLELASGGDADRPRERTFELGYSLLDRPYRDWVAELVEVTSAPARLEEWGQRARGTLADAGRSLVTAAGRDAMVGREVPKRGTDGTQWIDSALAEIWFRAAISKALTGRTPTHQEVA